MDKVNITGIDIAKNTFHAHGAGPDGAVVFRRTLTRGKLLEFLSDIEPCTVAMEACASAHHWGREIGGIGHSVRLIAPQYVKPFVKRQKNDAADAEAIAEAASRPSMYYPASDACIAERALCRRQERRPAGPGDAAEGPRPLDHAAHPDDQRPARASGRAWPDHPERAAALAETGGQAENRARSPRNRRRALRCPARSSGGHCCRALLLPLSCEMVRRQHA